MTQFFHRVGPRTSAVRQVWLLAILAVTATALVLTLMDLASRQVRATSQKLSETQEAMHKMAVSLDLRLSDAQNEQGAWLSGRPPARDDTTIKLEESLAERFSQVRSAPHLASISSNLFELEESVRGIKRLTDSCREWHHNNSNNAARLHAAKTNVSAVLQRLASELVQFESRSLSERQTNMQRLSAPAPGTAVNEIAQRLQKYDDAAVLQTKAHERLSELTFLFEHMFDEESSEALVRYRDALLPEATKSLLASLDAIRTVEDCTPGLIQAIDHAQLTLPNLLTGITNRSAGTRNTSATNTSLSSLCLHRIELTNTRAELLQESSDRIGEIRFNGIDLQIGFNTLQREASMAASLAMHQTGQRLLWFGASIGLVLLVLAFRIAGTLREQLNTIQRNSAELDKAATEAKSAADSLGRSEQRTRMIIDTAMDAVISMDANGRIVDWNKQAEQTFGWSNAEASGKTLGELIIPDHSRQAHADGFERFLRTGEGRVLNQRLEVRALRKDGAEIPVELSITPITYGGQVTFNAFLRDISDRKRAEEEILRSKARVEAVNTKLQASLETAERLTVEAQSASTAKSEFLATMSHEIRTPMNGIIGFTDLLLDTRLDEEQRDYLSTIKGSADALLAIINDILDFSKVEAGKMQLDPNWFDLNGVLTDVRRLLSTQAADKRLSLSLNCVQLPLPRIYADSSRVRQILLNLVGNAIKFTEKGSVTIRVEMEPIACETDVSATAYVRVSVTDTGIGIPFEKQARVFEKFVQADSSHSRRYGGTGLGLAICKSLVQLMGGTIGFESRPGHGSTFWFTLVSEKPAQCSPPPAEIEAPESGAFPAENNRGSASMLNLSEHELEKLAGQRVLIAEDNRANQRLVSTLLRKMRCEVEVVNSGRESVQKVREQTYALVLMDCHMPDMDGLEATAEIRKWEAANRSSHRIPIVALTASLMDEDKRLCKLAGMDDFLGKPIQLEELTRTIKQWATRTDHSLKAP